MKKLKDLIIETKCRKGESAGTTKRGAYWLAGEPAKIRAYGGDGIGQSGASVQHYLEFRYFRSGEVQAVIHRDAWHQDGGGDSWHDASAVLDCATIEDAIVVLKGLSCGEKCNAYSDWGKDALVKALSALGLPMAGRSRRMRRGTGRLDR